MTLTLFSPHQALCHGANSWSVENSRGQAKEKKMGKVKVECVKLEINHSKGIPGDFRLE